MKRFLLEKVENGVFLNDKTRCVGGRQRGGEVWDGCRKTWGISLGNPHRRRIHRKKHKGKRKKKNPL